MRDNTVRRAVTVEITRLHDRNTIDDRIVRSEHSLSPVFSQKYHTEMNKILWLMDSYCFATCFIFVFSILQQCLEY